MEFPVDAVGPLLRPPPVNIKLLRALECHTHLAAFKGRRIWDIFEHGYRQHGFVESYVEDKSTRDLRKRGLESSPSITAR